MNSHNIILQLDGNTSECVNEVREQNEYEKRDPNNREEAPYFLSDEDLEDFVIQCKVCDIEKDGKKEYNTHVSRFHPCEKCSTLGSDIHFCPYRDFIIL